LESLRPRCTPGKNTLTHTVNIKCFYSTNSSITSLYATYCIPNTLYLYYTPTISITRYTDKVIVIKLLNNYAFLGILEQVLWYWITSSIEFCWPFLLFQPLKYFVFNMSIHWFDYYYLFCKCYIQMKTCHHHVCFYRVFACFYLITFVTSLCIASNAYHLLPITCIMSPLCILPTITNLCLFIYMNISAKFIIFGTHFDSWITFHTSIVVISSLVYVHTTLLPSIPNGFQPCLTPDSPPDKNTKIVFALYFIIREYFYILSY